MTKIDVPADRALNPAEKKLAKTWSSKFVAAERKTAISFLETAKLVAEAQAELEPEVFKRAYEEAGWGFDKVQKYLRVGRRTYLYKDAFKPVLPQITSFWILNFLAGLTDEQLEAFIAEYTSKPRPIDRKELLAFAGRSPAKSDTLLDYTIDREKISNLTPEVKKRIFAKVEELKRVADDHELPTKLKTHEKVIALLKLDEARLAISHDAEPQAPDAVQLGRAKNDDTESQAFSQDAANDGDDPYATEREDDIASRAPAEDKDYPHLIEGELANNDATQSQALSKDSGSDDPVIDTAELTTDQNAESAAPSSVVTNQEGSDR